MAYNHDRGCIIGFRPELITIGPCFGGCGCTCHVEWQQQEDATPVGVEDDCR